MTRLSSLTAGRPAHAVEQPDIDPVPLPPPPEHLGSRQRTVWARLAAIVDPLKIATHADVDAFAMLVVAVAICEQAAEALAEVGLTYEQETRHGVTLRRRPELDVLQAYQKLALVHMSRFGLTPADRRRVSPLGEEPIDTADPINEFDQTSKPKRSRPRPVDPVEAEDDGAE